MKKSLAALTIFLGSMLLFGVQPMVGRTLLPFFGGTSAVWVVCLCSFQILLLGGYFYAHRLAGARGRAASLVHLALLFASAGWAYFVADHRGLLSGLLSGVTPVFGVMVFLLMIVGLPYLALSANSSLVQSVAARGGKDVYRLYSVSNIGSFVGLFLYPFVLEPFVSVGGQWRIFAAGLAVYAALLLVCLVGRDGAAGVRALPSEDGAVSEAQGTRHGAHGTFLWIFLPALSCAILNAVTAHLTLNVIAMPLLWCILLALFLLTYIIGFAGFAGRYLRVWDALAFASAATLAVTTAMSGEDGFCWQLAGGCGLVLFGGTALHVRLYESRPGAAQLTRYYLYGAVGGAVGGTLTGLVAPLVFTKVHEYPLTVVAAVVTLAALRDWRRWARQLPVAAVAAAIVAVLAFRINVQDARMGDEVYADRGFFGTVRVTTSPARTATVEGVFHQFWHGSTLHCGQFVAPGYPLKATLYHGPRGGGFAILRHPKYGSGAPMRVGIVGMGMGVSCAYGRTNDVYRCWEISPEALNLATNGQFFSFSTATPAKVETVLGDARLALEEERRTGAPKYDLLQIDAFSGDSPPYHLCTEEAFELYFDRLAPGGYLAVNISNWHMDLRPLLKAMAIRFEAHTLVYTPNYDVCDDTPTVWAVMMKEAPVGFKIPKDIRVIDLRKVRDWTLPTDEKGSLVGLIHL